MFQNEAALNSDLSRWNVDNVTNMKGLFRKATVFNSDLSKWNVVNINI